MLRRATSVGLLNLKKKSYMSEQFPFSILDSIVRSEHMDNFEVLKPHAPVAAVDKAPTHMYRSNCVTMMVQQIAMFSWERKRRRK